ncbi:unnamed protein product [Mytilus edulis]|uniref:Uncharacterized protein n=1 Tax=Mytilus edulis TaxID=6550 RepID=A0A8S3UCF7_MYTED|nr:unnamed protein product [Mytilus edulis]
MLENTIYHGPSKSNTNKQYFPRPSTRQPPGTDSHFSNKKNHTLDLFLTNRPSLVNRCEPLPGIGDHDIVYIDTDITAKEKIFIWKKADAKEQVEKAMKLNADFKEKFNLESPITAMWEFIKTSLLTILEQTVPSKMSSSRFNQPWINQKIKKLTRQKKRSFEKARKTKRKSDLDRYHRLKAATQKECRKAYRDYINDIINPELSANPKRFWGFIKTIPTQELHTTSSVARGHTTRFLVPYARTSTYRHSFFPDSIRIWNSLPQPLVDSTSLDAFKQGVLSCSIP